MNVVFIYPECENLGVAYLSACLKKAGHHVKLAFDPMLFDSYYFRSNGLKKIFSFRSRVINEVLSAQYDLVCFSVFADHYGWACDIAAEIKNKNKNIRIIFGGVHPSSVPELVIQEPFVDYVCVGEGELPMVELADRLQQGADDTGILNIWTKSNGRVIKNELRPLLLDLDALPFPDKEIFRDEYKNFSGKVYSIITARGCPNACTYCYNSYFRELYRDKGPYLRRRSVDNVIAELVHAKEKYGIQRVAFFDDLFIYDLNWLQEFSGKYSEKIGLPYFCHVHPSNINERSVQLLKASGCSTVTMGIQTINEDIRKKILDRHDSNEQICKAVKLIKGSGIFLYTNIIFGLPLQDENVMVEDIRFANHFRVDIPASNWLRYYPRTEIVRIAKDLAVLNAGDIDTMEESKAYMPYSIDGNTYGKNGAKLRNMLLLTHLLPEKWADYILDHRLYKFLPSFNLRFYIQILIITYRKIFLGKKFPFAYLSLMDIVQYHLHYMFKKVCSRGVA
ncbi:MAG: B12-binding domain-containing radical SAM protein [Candidatus Omnitrophica bacterium]|nr:B12-binding domain-containing radical SAM protein [Candidatus Omnitrophota bacterium]